MMTFPSNLSAIYQAAIMQITFKAFLRHNLKEGFCLRFLLSVILIIHVM